MDTNEKLHSEKRFSYGTGLCVWAGGRLPGCKMAPRRSLTNCRVEGSEARAEMGDSVAMYGGCA